MIEKGLCQCGCGQKTTIAPTSNPKYGTAKGEPYNYVRGHGPHVVRLRPGLDWIEEDRGYDTACWIWQRAATDGGYGTVEMDGECRAHRAVYKHYGLEIPEGLTLDHLCRVPACVNPAHLEPVTHAENCRRGAATKLTWDDVAEIRRSPESNVDVAERFGISRVHAYRIRKFQIWTAA